MPIFEFRCQKCGTKFEAILQSSSQNRPACRNCSSQDVQQLLSVFAVASAGRNSGSAEPGPCGACGAPRRGMCGE